jgi:hypothetical protein
MPDQDPHDWKMVPGTGMVPADRPAVRLGGEQRPAGGGPRGRDYVSSPDDGPPVPASDQVAAASRPAWPSGVSN